MKMQYIIFAGSRCTDFSPCDDILCGAHCDALGYKNPKPHCLYTKIGHTGDKCCC